MRDVLPQEHPERVHCNSLHAVTCFFNPKGYRRPVENYWRFREAFQAPLTTVECLFGNQEPEIPDAIHVRTNSVLWHKESLLNIAIDRTEADAIAWVDCDLIFRNPQWVEFAMERLEKYAVAQLFGKSHTLYPDGVVEPFKLATGRLFHHRHETWSQFTMSHPGYAWVARASWLKRHKLADIHVIGGGDSFMLGAFVDRPFLQQSRMNDAYRAANKPWHRAVANDVQRSFSYVPGDVYHLWHGSRDNRRYITRFEDLAHYDPVRDLARDQYGLWQWTEAADPRTVEAVNNHFAIRKEDDVYERLAH